jgi:ABC-type multidrug transport system ATPase subunit
MTCQIGHENTGMGPFEPVICQGGFYCPKGGREKVKCPAGHYCPPGTAQPTPCAVGSACPAGSLSQRFYIPTAILIIFDVCLILGMLLLRLRKRVKKDSDAHHNATGGNAPRPGLRRIMTDRAAGYKSVRADEESPPVSEPGTPRRALTGFEAALAMEQGQRIQDMADLSPELRSFVQSMQRATDASHLGLSFQYADLSFQPKGLTRPILQNVTGSINSGSLTAVMGGSGAGKSTFVNVLMGKTTNTGGLVMVNDTPNKMKKFRKQVGFVPQDDIVLAELTVYENILHSARVRLPRTWEDKDIRAHVDSVIDCLELSHVRDSRVGTVGKPLISGGQRKRVSIGMELAAAPMAIFLDEPTSGLDATAASSIMRTLKAIARVGISVIVIIHQPRMEIFEMLDQLILLANGQIIYEGPEDYVQQYFENCGFAFPPHANAGDVVTDIITGNGRSYKAKGDTSKDWLISNWTGSRQHAQIKERHASVVSTLSSSHRHQRSLTPSSLVNMSKSSLLMDQHQSLCDPAMLEALRKRGAPRLKQTWLCLRRAMIQQWRDKTSFWFEMGLASVAAALLGLAQHSRNGVLFRGIYVGDFAILSNAVDLTSAPQLSLLMGVAIGLISAAPGVRVFSEEMLLHRREAEAGHSRLAYFLAKVLCVLPRMLVACMHFSAITLLLAKPVIPWGIAFVANLGYFWCVYGMSAVISMVAKREDAPLLATMASLIVGILCGAAPTLAQVSKWNMAWLWRTSPGVWLGELYFGELVRPFGYLYQTDLAAATMGYSLDSTWRNIGVLIAIGVVYRLIAYAGLFLGKRIRI